jgi:hypothetical protein
MKPAQDTALISLVSLVDDLVGELQAIRAFGKSIQALSEDPSSMDDIELLASLAEDASNTALARLDQHYNSVRGG